MPDSPQNAVVADRASIHAVAAKLRDAMADLIAGVSGDAASTAALARRLGVNRVIASRLLNAIRRNDLGDVLLHIPGPDSLRAIVGGARALDGTPEQLVDRAADAIDLFAALIRDRFGTRGALDAALSAESAASRERYEENARYDVYNGMRHVVGVEGETWLTAMIFSIHPEDEDAITTTNIHGVLGMRRLRPDVPVRFTFGPPYSPPGRDPDPLESPVGLREFYTNAPAPLETETQDGRLIHSLAQGAVGKDALVDMLAVSHAPKAAPRFRTPERLYGGAAVIHDIPVRAMHFDAIVHRDVFPGSAPSFNVYNTAARGPANPNDRSRDIDRVLSSPSAEAFPLDLQSMEEAGVPNYAAMLRRVLRDTKRDPGDYRVYRHRVVYPVHGFQYVLAFEAPDRP